MGRKSNGVRRAAGVLAMLTAVSLAGCGQTGKEAEQAAADVAQVQEAEQTKKEAVQTAGAAAQVQEEERAEQTAGADVQAREAEHTGVGEMQAESAAAGEEAQGKTGSESAAGQQSEATGKSAQADDGMRQTSGAANDGQQTGQTNGEKERLAQSKKEPPAGWQLTLASEDWGLSFGEPGTQSVGNASSEDLAWYDAYYVGSDDEKVIYLTFDCGYENGNTEPILDALKKHDVQATFFVVGHFLETAPEMVKRMVEEGHTVGNHTYHHPDMPTISDQEAFRKELDDVAALFAEITGTELSSYYRPPQGKCNVENLRMAQEMGYHTIFWSLAYVDWDQDNQPGHEEAFSKLTGRVHPGAVVLLHNTSQTNGEILDELLTRWEEMGYTFRPLSELVYGGDSKDSAGE